MSNLGYESEKILEENLIKQLKADGYEYVKINDIGDLHRNFRKQINKHNAKRLNGHKLSDKEFQKTVAEGIANGVENHLKNVRNHHYKRLKNTRHNKSL